MISFFLTTDCNLCCTYCYNALERSKILNYSVALDVAFAGVDWYFNNNESRHIRFYGPGEPTLEFAKMKDITDYAKHHPNRGHMVTVEIQTNGVFTDEVRKWILENANIVWVSFDGPPDIQNFNRPLNHKYDNIYDSRLTSTIVENNVRWLNEHKCNRNLMVGARVTITNANINLQREMIDYFKSLGIRYAWTDPLFDSVECVPVFSDANRQASHYFDYDTYIANYVDAWTYGKNNGFFWGTFLAVNFDGSTCYHCRSCTPLEAPHITPDGYISACDMVVLGSNPHHMDPFIIGKWNKANQSFDIDYEKVLLLNSRKSTDISHCCGCIAQMHCGGYCLGEIVNETGNLWGQNKLKCHAIRSLYSKIGPCEPYAYFHP